jgi:Uncharacterized conserved protein
MATANAMTEKSATAEKRVRTAARKIDETQVRAQVERIRSDIAGLKSAITDYSVDRAQELGAAARETADDLSETTRRAIETLNDELASLERQLVDHVRRRPLQSLGIAAAVGVLFALLVKR